MKNQKPPYLLIGTLTKDRQPDGSYKPGGTPTYASALINNLGWQPVILSAVGSDFSPPPHMAQDRWHLAPSPETTTYHNIYRGEERRQIIGPVGRPITLTDIPAECENIDLVHLCPLAQDVDLALVDHFKNAFLVTTLQGWLRQWDESGLVSMRNWRYMAHLLPLFKAVAVSIEDLNGDWGIAEEMATLAPLLVVTDGGAGCHIFQAGERFHIPPRPAQIADFTGAGDSFGAAFFIRYHQTGKVKEAAYFANVAASMTLERTGAENAPSLAEIEAYIQANPLK